MTQSKHFYCHTYEKLTIVVVNKVGLHHSTDLGADLPRPRATAYAAAHLVARGRGQAVFAKTVALFLERRHIV